MSEDDLIRVAKEVSKIGHVMGEDPKREIAARLDTRAGRCRVARLRLVESLMWLRGVIREMLT